MDSNIPSPAFASTNLQNFDLLNIINSNNQQQTIVPQVSPLTPWLSNPLSQFDPNFPVPFPVIPELQQPPQQQPVQSKNSTGWNLPDDFVGEDPLILIVL
jgi:hypothetical protein